MMTSNMAKSATLWTENEFSEFCNALETVTPEQMEAVTGDFSSIISNLLQGNPNKLKRVPYDKTKDKLTKAAELKLSVLELFTHKEYIDKNGCMLVYDHDTLAKINEKFDMHGVWMIKAPYTDESGRHQFLEMQFLLVGLGKMIIGYPGNQTVTVNDYEVSGSNRYDYTRYTEMDIINNDGKRGFKNITTRELPKNKGSGFFQGPINANILSMKLSGTEIEIKCKIGISFHKYVRNIPISLR